MITNISSKVEHVWIHPKRHSKIQPCNCTFNRTALLSHLVILKKWQWLLETNQYLNIWAIIILVHLDLSISSWGYWFVRNRSSTKASEILTTEFYSQFCQHSYRPFVLFSSVNKIKFLCVYSQNWMLFLIYQTQKIFSLNFLLVHTYSWVYFHIKLLNFRCFQHINGTLIKKICYIS